jgi:flagellar hook-associated protein 2
MTTGSITFGGVASGLDVNFIIDELTALARRPIILAESRSLVLQQQQDAVGSINTSLSNLLSNIAALKDPSIVGARGTSVVTTVAQANALQASASSSAAIGSFTVNISQLATPTKVASGSSIGQAVSAAVPLDQAGFDVAFVAGTFTINSTQFTIPASTPSTAESATAVGSAIDLDAKLNVAGYTITPAATGTFDINGVQINYDASLDSMNDVIARINGSAANVTASYDAATDKLKLTNTSNGPTAVTYSDVSGNFMEFTNFVDGVPTPIATEVAGTAHKSLNDVISDINGAGIGVTASISGGNLLQLTSASSISLGSGSDTSNFLTATHILESPAGSTRTSVQGMGAASPTATLASARLQTALSPSTGSFTINGKSIVYDASVDSLQNVIDRINQSEAGVTALYDAYNDTFSITSDSTGSSAIGLADVTGNFLTSMGVLGAQTLGVNAQYSINGGPTQYASTNQVNDAVAGVTLTLKETTTTAVNVDVFSDTGLVAARISEFVEQYNSLTGQIRDFTEFVEDGQNGVLFGDGALRRLDQGLRSLMTGIATGITGDVNSFSAIGLSFGVVGSAVGATDTLVFNRATFDAAVASDPAAVRAVLTAFDASIALDAGGTGSIASISGKPTAVSDSGAYSIVSDVLGNLTVTFTPDNGSTPVVSTGTIAAGGTNTTIIPGVTLTAKATLVAGTDALSVTADQEGMARSLHDYVEGFTRTGGILDTKTGEMQSRLDDISDQIDRLEERVTAKRDQLIRRFSALEQTMARLQSQQAALSSVLAQLQSIQPRSSQSNNR